MKMSKIVTIEDVINEAMELEKLNQEIIEEQKKQIATLTEYVATLKGIIETHILKNLSKN